MLLLIKKIKSMLSMKRQRRGVDGLGLAMVSLAIRNFAQIKEKTPVPNQATPPRRGVAQAYQHCA